MLKTLEYPNTYTYSATFLTTVGVSKIKAKEYTFTGVTEGNFAKDQLPTLIDLKLKIGAQVMMLNNDSGGRFINGTIGKITSIDKDEEIPKLIILLETGKTVSIAPYTWESYHFYLEGTELKSGITGTFTQYPVMLAWAITIHKSQGKTFDKVILDIGKGTFAHGQMYVALSRCTCLEGLVIKKKIAKKHIWMDWNVVKFVTEYQYKKSAQECPTEDKIKIIEDAIKNRLTLNITYLKAKDEKSSRLIQPTYIGEMLYLGKTYTGIQAFCLKRRENRVFKVDRILAISYHSEN